MTARPTELDLWTRGTADVTKMPSIPFLGYRFVNEIYMYSDLLKTIIRSLVQETFRKGITIEPRFVVKCVICGTEYDTKVETCEVCGSHKLRPPNPFEKRWMEEFMHDVNYNDQSLVEVLQDVDTDLNIYDNAYLAVVKRYDFNSEGKVVGAEVVEVLRASPENVLLIMDKEGRPGRTDDGRVVMICLEHRDKYVAVLPEHVKETRCQTCGKWMYPAYFAVRKSVGEGGFLYYTDGEILHIKKFTHGLGYGLSPIFAVWMKVLTLIKQDFFILTAYHLERSPRGVLILRGQFDAIQKAWHKLQTEAQTNPHIIYPLIVEGADKVNRIAEWIDLSFSAKDIDFIQYREEVRRTVGALWGVMPIFHGDTGGGMGLANEGLQIVVTNRAVEREQTLFNEKVLSWLSRQLGVSDWEYQLVPNEGRDVVARIQRETMRIGNAERMAQLGYRPIAIKTDDGIDFYYEYAGKPIAEEKASGYIAGKIYQEVPEREIPRHEGEPEHGRPRVDEQRFEGEELARRPKTPSTFVVGEGGELIPEEEVGKSLFRKEAEAEVPVEYRRYIRREDISRLPTGTRVHRGPRGGLFIDVREVPEHVREKLEVSEEERRQERAVVTYGGKLTEKLRYGVEVDKEKGEAKIRFEKEGNVLEFSADLKSRSIKVTNISFSQEPESLIRTLEGNWFVRGLFEKYPVSETYRYVLYPSSWEKVFSLKQIKEGYQYSAADMKLVSKEMENDIELLSRPISYWEEVSSEDGFNFYYSEGIKSLKPHEKSVNLFKQAVRNKFGGNIIFLPEGSIRAGGLFDPYKMTVTVGNHYFSTMCHEYLHYVFDMYSKLLSFIGVLEFDLGNAINSLFEEETESGDKVGLTNFSDYAAGRDIPEEVQQLGNLWGEFVRRAEQDFRYDLGKALLEYFESRSTERIEAKWERYVKNVVDRLNRLIDYFGGKEALSKFEELIRFLRENGGLTPYSDSWKDVDTYMAATEAFASLGDLIGDFFEWELHRKNLGLKKFTRANLVRFYKGVASDSPAHILYFKKGKEKVLEKALDFLDSIGLINWEE